MPFPQPPPVGAGNEYAVPTPVFAPQQPQQPLPQIGFAPQQAQPPSAPPPQYGGAIGAVPVFTGGNVGPWGAGAGAGMFGSGFGGLPSLAGAFGAARNMISSGAGLVGGLLGGAVGGPVGAIAGRFLGNRFFGGEQAQEQPPAFDMTPRSDLNALERSLREQGANRGFGTYRGGDGFVTGVIDPASVGIYEGSGMERSRAPQTSAMNQMR